METLINYKKRIASRFVPLEGDSAQNDLPESKEYLYSEKIDGHLGFAVVENGLTTFYNRSATKLDLPNLEKQFPKKEGIWAGELYLDQERSRSFQVSSAIVNAKDDVCFAVFDAVHELDKSVLERIAIIESAIPVGEKIHPVKWNKTESRKEIIAVYDEAVAQGKEGLIVHPGQGISYKLKPIIQLDLTVLGYSMKEDGSGLRSMLVGLKQGDNWMVVASVGGGFSEDDRAKWVPKLEALVVESDIVMVAKNRLAYKWIEPKIVIQIKCIEAINEDSTSVILKELLYYNPKKGYFSQGKTSGVSLVSPIFQGVREDKEPGGEDTGINQITDRIELITTAKEEDNKIASEIVFRKVYIKEGKTGVAVRKFVGLKTNKNNYPNFVLYYTDFSAGRKEPLQTEITLAASEDKLNEKLGILIEENIKKGWNEV